MKRFSLGQEVWMIQGQEPRRVFVIGVVEQYSSSLVRVNGQLQRITNYAYRVSDANPRTGADLTQYNEVLDPELYESADSLRQFMLARFENYENKIRNKGFREDNGADQ